MSKLRVTHFPNECEFPFQAYSPFTVIVQVPTAGTAADPYLITLEPAIDGKLEDERLPLTPWF